MTRIAEFQTIQRIMYMVSQQRQNIATLSDQISSGVRVKNPSDSNDAGTISMTQQMLERAKGHKSRIATVQSLLSFQDNTIGSANELLVRASEIAQQAANESNTPQTRAQLAEEVFQIRDHMINLANSTYMGRYVFSGADDGTPSYSPATYVNPPAGEASQRYVYDTDPTAQVTRTVKVSDDVSVQVNTPGDQIFDGAVQALERLGRSLAGFKTLPATGAPDGTGAAYGADETAVQTADIRNCIDLLKTARESDLTVERVNIAGRMRRLDTASSLLELSENSGEDVLDKLQNTDIFEAGSQYSMAQTALESALAVNSRLLGQSILDYL